MRTRARHLGGPRRRPDDEDRPAARRSRRADGRRGRRSRRDRRTDRGAAGPARRLAAHVLEAAIGIVATDTPPVDACSDGRSSSATCGSDSRRRTARSPALPPARPSASPSSSAPTRASEVVVVRDRCHCGASVLADDDFCESCGAALVEAARDHVEAEAGACAAVSDRGLVHARNEDAVHVAARDGHLVAVVCDGVSTCAAPEVAAAVAATSCADALALGRRSAMPWPRRIERRAGHLVEWPAPRRALDDDRRRPTMRPGCTWRGSATAGPTGSTTKARRGSRPITRWPRSGERRRCRRREALPTST